MYAFEKRIKGVTTSNVALTGNWTILFAIEVVMALVAWSRYTTVRHSTIETSGPPQEVRHTCSGVCVPIIRAPTPPLQCVPSSMAHTGSKQHATDILPFVRGNVNHRGKEKKVNEKTSRRRRNDITYHDTFDIEKVTTKCTYSHAYIFIYIYIYV